MPSIYLEPSDYIAYGVPDATAQQVTQASILIDGYLQRPEGLIYATDANGNPCYMLIKNPNYTLIATQSISPGTNVIVNVSGGVLQVQNGEVITLDRGTPSITETCIVLSVNGQALTLQSVQFSHDVDATLDFGMTIFEEKQMPAGRPITSLSRWPLVGLLSGRGRYGYGRRGSSGNFATNQYNLLAAITTFGGPPIWEIFNASLVDYDRTTSNVWSPSGIYLSYFTQIQFWYVAGWTYLNLPAEIKQACVNIMLAILDFPIYGNVKSYRAGDTAVQYGGYGASGAIGVIGVNNYIDPMTKALLDPYRARVFV